MKQSIKLDKCWKCGRTSIELEKVGLTLERMAAYFPAGSLPEKEIVIQICSEDLQEIGLK